MVHLELDLLVVILDAGGEEGFKEMDAGRVIFTSKVAYQATQAPQADMSIVRLSVFLSVWYCIKTKLASSG